jgi:mono/diheme cytochrome c family protein
MSGRAALWIAGMMLGTVLFSAAVDNSWVERVPEADRTRTNPYAGKADAVAAGSKLFADHCAKCHGSDALGRGKRPSLRSKEVQQFADGQIFWFLRNGNLRREMPSWSSLPEPSRWQIIAYLRSLGAQTSSGTSSPSKGSQP